MPSDNDDDDNDNKEDEDEEEEDDDDEYYNTKPYERVLEAMYNTKRFREHCDGIDKIVKWIEKFSRKFELVYEKKKGICRL